MLSAPKEYRNNLIQKSYRLKFKDSFWHTFGIYADVVLCYHLKK